MRGRGRVRIFSDFPTFFSDFATPSMISLHFLVIPLHVSVISLLWVNSVSVISLPLFFNVLEVFCFAREIILMGVRLLLFTLQLWGG